MAVRKKEEILEWIKKKIGDSTEDEDLIFLEDLDDTFNDYESRGKEETDWKSKYEENDKEWRRKYRDRFFDGKKEEREERYEEREERYEDGEDEVKEKTKFEELFEEKEEEK